MVVDENCCGFEVAVHYTVVQKELQSENDVTREEAHRLFPEKNILQKQLHDAAAGAILQDEPEVISGFKPFKETHDVRVGQRVQERNLVLRPLLLRFVDAFKSMIQYAVFAAPLVNHSALAAADFVHDAELIH